MFPKENPSTVVIGGGTGTFTTLCALKDKPISLTALMTMVDDGGSNRVIRDEFGLLPTSGIRQAMVALSPEQSLMRELFSYRYHQGNGIKGMTFGNLFMAAMADICGSQAEAIQQTAKFLGVKGEIYPISDDDVRLVAHYEDGSRVTGEHLIDEPCHDGRLRIAQLSTIPTAHINTESKNAIKKADMIILGPGDFYTNTIANLVVEGVVEALLDCKAFIVFCINLMTKYGEAFNYKASDYLKDLNAYLPLTRLNGVVINNDHRFPEAALNKYLVEKSIPVIDDLDSMNLPSSLRVVRAPLLSQDEIPTQKGDTIKRSIIRHDQEKLGYTLMQLFSLL